MKKPLISLVLFAGVLTLLVACKKDDEKPKSVDVSFAEDHAMAEGEVSNVNNISREQIENSQAKTSQGILWSLPNGVTGTLDLQASPKLSINFGTSGILCNDGRTRKGWVYVDWTGDYSATGTVITTTTKDYYVNNHWHKIRRVVTNEGENDQDQETFTVAEWDTITLADNSGTIFWQSNRTRTWTEGKSTPLDIYDDVYTVTGTANGLTRAGRTYSMVTITPLTIKLNCRYIFSGILDVMPQDAETIRVDYGNGCELGKTARVSVAGFSADVPLR
ncbi:MAG: hypothetical protein KF690_00430 [Bacteroidetes bacterium]|nr:hypothetical protein [Bacteroidota bacterium]